VLNTSKTSALQVCPFCNIRQRRCDAEHMKMSGCAPSPVNVTCDIRSSCKIQNVAPAKNRKMPHFMPHSMGTKQYPITIVNSRLMATLKEEAAGLTSKGDISLQSAESNLSISSLSRLNDIKTAVDCKKLFAHASKVSLEIDDTNANSTRIIYMPHDKTQAAAGWMANANTNQLHVPQTNARKAKTPVPTSPAS